MITEEMHVESFLIWMVHSPVDIAKISWFKFDYTVSMCNDNDRIQNEKYNLFDVAKVRAPGAYFSLKF